MSASEQGAGDGAVETIRIVDLGDHPAHRETVFGWYAEEWGDVYPPEELSFDVAQLRAPGPPIVLVALSGDEPVGTISIDPDDVPERSDLAPWLASLYVVPAHRNRGIARRLIDAVLARAAREGIAALHLMTFDLEAWYQGMGWQTVEHARYHDRPVAFMVHPTPSDSTSPIAPGPTAAGEGP